MIGVYFLIKDNKVVYIGQTKNWPLRLKKHIGQLMDFDSQKFIECDENKLNSLEAAYIRKYRPVHNYNSNPDKTQKAIRSKKYIQKAIYRKNKFLMVFRTLTAKSVIGIGKFRNIRVSHLLATGRYLEIASLYYNLSHVSFHADVLTEIGIVGKWVIEKPGVNKDMLYDFGREVHPDKVIFAKRKADQMRIKSIKDKSIEATRLSKNKSFEMNRHRRTF